MFLPHPIIWHSGSFRLTSHGLFFALGAEAAGLVLQLQARRCGLNSRLVWPLLLITFASGLAGARLLFLILYPDQAGGWSQLLNIWNGGLVSYGGLLAGGYAAYRYIRRFAPEQAALWQQAAVLATLLAWGIGRIGNFLAGDSAGLVSTVWQLTYGRVPIQLFESLLCFLLVLLLWRSKSNIVLLAAAGYFFGRFVIDVWRDETVLIILHASQWASLLALVCICFIYARSRP